MNAKEKIIKAKVTLIINNPWFGQLSIYINPIERIGMAKSGPGPVGINARGDLFYDPEWIDALPAKQIKGILCHEILHLAYQHVFRYGKRDSKLYNIAADIKVNYDLVHEGFELPENTYTPSRYDEYIDINGKRINDIRNKTSEQIYEELEKIASKNPQLTLQDLIAGAGTPDGDAKDGTPKQLSGSQIKQLEQEWKEKLNAANAQFKESLPAGLQREIDSLENPELPWTQILRQRFMGLKKKLSWSKVNKRYLPNYFPGIKVNKTITAMIAIDTSGSISRKQLTKAASEIWGLTSSFREFKFYVVTCDARDYDVMELNNKTREKFLKLKFDGGGGTDFRPVFELVHKKFNDKVDCLIYFTDGEGDFPDKQPRYQVYWVTDSGHVTWPFGKVIKINQ
jgi:predicted metal-dependent peptidase